MNEGSAQSYSNLALNYDCERFSSTNGKFLFNIDRDLVLDFVRMANPKRILDMPTGTGRVLNYLKATDCQVVGLDYTEEMLTEARKVADPERHTLRQGNAASTGFNNSEFDCLISLRFFHLFPREERLPFGREFCRVIKPGGHIIVSFTNGWYAGGLNWVKKMCGLQTVQFGYPGEVGELFPGWTIREVRGNYLPKQWMVDGVPVLGSTLRFMTRHLPLNRLCWETFYLLQKPENQNG